MVGATGKEETKTLREKLQRKYRKKYDPRVRNTCIGRKGNMTLLKLSSHRREGEKEVVCT